MAPSKNFEILISILFALRGVLGQTSSANNGGGALTTASPGDLATVTIIDMPAYSIAVGCVRECLMQEFEPGVPDGLIIAAALGCTSPYYNGCYCTSAVASSASSLISRCIIAECSGTAEIPDAFSIYNNYCTTAGYPGPAANIAQTTTTAQNSEQTAQPSTAVFSSQNGAQTAQPSIAGFTSQISGQTAQLSTTLLTGAVVYTVTNAGSTFLITETAVQTLISTPSSSPSGGGGGSKVNIGAIVGGLLGGLVLIAVALGVFHVWLPRRQKRKAAAVSQQSGEFEETAQGAEGKTFGPAAAAGKAGGGRAELPRKGGVGVGEKEVIAQVKETEMVGGGNLVGQREGVEVDGVGLGVRELGGEGRYGLRPEELDSEGRYVGELHSDGRQHRGVELEGRGVR